jgi:hypothetical protein
MEKGPAVKMTSLGGALGACAVAIPVLVAGATGMPAAEAKNGDTHITGVGLVKTVDCNDSTLLVNGSSNVITAMGTCWAVTMQGSSNTVIADAVTNDITVYGFDQTVFFHNGTPALVDRGRELGMTNRISRIPA